MLQVNAWRPGSFWLCFSSILPVLCEELGFKLAGPPKIDKNFLRECDFIVSLSACYDGTPRLLWWISLVLESLADCWYLELFWSSSRSDRKCDLDWWETPNDCGCTYLKKLAPFLRFYLPSFPFFITFIYIKSILRLNLLTIASIHRWKLKRKLGGKAGF